MSYIGVNRLGRGNISTAYVEIADGKGTLPLRELWPEDRVTTSDVMQDEVNARPNSAKFPSETTTRLTTSIRFRHSLEDNTNHAFTNPG